VISVRPVTDILGNCFGGMDQGQRGWQVVFVIPSVTLLELHGSCSFVWNLTALSVLSAPQLLSARAFICMANYCLCTSQHWQPLGKRHLKQLNCYVQGYQHTSFGTQHCPCCSQMGKPRMKALHNNCCQPSD
jgi:hypothetical protein